jgi:hypothetical protein
MRQNLFFFFVAIGALFAIGGAYRLLLAANGFTVTSWWRNPLHNAEVGGVKKSFHLIGLAWDVVPVSAANIQKAQDLGFHVLIEDDHLHLQLL